MNTQKITGFLRQNLLFYTLGFFILFGMKYYYSQADAENLRWILGPTARWVEALSGIPFVYAPGMGYANHSLRFLIAPSCSGVQFLIITAAMLIFSFVHAAADFRFPGHSSLKRSSLPIRCGHHGQDLAETAGTASDADTATSTQAADPEKTLPATGKPPQGSALARTGKGLCWILVSLLLSYLFTVFVNGLRIIAAIYLPLFFERFHVFRGFLTADRLHTMIGAVVYFAALLTIHQFVGLLFAQAHGTDKRQAPALLLRKCLSPVFWYFSIVLGIPFLNRAYQKSGAGFTDFCLLVTLCCGSVLLLYGLVFLICRRLKGRN